MLVIKKILQKILALFLLPLQLVPKGKIIIIQTYDLYIYCENTRHLYEYLSKNSTCEVYWMTEHPEIQTYITKRGWRYLSHTGFKNLIHKIWVMSRARVAIDSGTRHYNFLGLIGKRCVKMTTLHGNGPKTIVINFDRLKQTLQQIYDYHNFDFVNFNTMYCSYAIGRKIFRLPENKRLALGSPRCDILFNKAEVNAAYQQKPIAHRFKPSLKEGAKIILYTPTWRTYEFDFPLYQLAGYNNEDFEDFLAANNIYFFYSFHSVRGAQRVPPVSEHIVLISHKKDPFYDTNFFMCETDLLVNDYSNTSTDYLLLGKPQIFVMPDFERYEREQGFVEDYLPILPGPEVKTYADFKETLLSALANPCVQALNYQEQRRRYLAHYYDETNTSSCGNFLKVIDQLMDKGLPA